jgi:hypothetical protein
MANCLQRELLMVFDKSLSALIQPLCMFAVQPVITSCCTIAVCMQPVATTSQSAHVDGWTQGWHGLCCTHLPHRGRGGACRFG